MMTSGEDPAQQRTATDIVASARGWHGVQLAVLGLIGLCGVLNGMADGARPRSVQVAAGLLVLSALVLACLAVAAVATVAWPLRPSVDGDPERLARRLRAGVTATFVAVALLALATSSWWWPTAGPGPDRLLVQTGTDTVCGRVQDSGNGRLALDVNGRTVLIQLRDVGRLQVVHSC